VAEALIDVGLRRHGVHLEPLPHRLRPLHGHLLPALVPRQRSRQFPPRSGVRRRRLGGRRYRLHAADARLERPGGELHRRGGGLDRRLLQPGPLPLRALP